MENFQIAFKSIQLLKLMKVQQRGAQIRSGWIFSSLPYCVWSSFPSGTQQMLHHHIKDLVLLRGFSSLPPLQAPVLQGTPTLYMPCPVSVTGNDDLQLCWKQMDLVGKLSEVNREKDKKYMPAPSWGTATDHQRRTRRPALGVRKMERGNSSF